MLASGARPGYDLLVGVPPHRAPSALRDPGLVNDAGWVMVDRRTLRTSFERVYAVGDATSITVANGKPLPKAGVFAHAEAVAAGGELAAALAGATSRQAFAGHGCCWLETGEGRAAFADGDFHAEPDPIVGLRRPGRVWHAGKVLFERCWLSSGLAHRLSAAALSGAGGLVGVRAELWAGCRWHAALIRS